jgi:hypothetical protein
MSFWTSEFRIEACRRRKRDHPGVWKCDNAVLIGVLNAGYNVAMAHKIFDLAGVTKLNRSRVRNDLQTVNWWGFWRMPEPFGTRCLLLRPRGRLAYTFSSAPTGRSLASEPTRLQAADLSYLSYRHDHGLSDPDANFRMFRMAYPCPSVARPVYCPAGDSWLTKLTLNHTSSKPRFPAKVRRATFWCSRALKKVISILLRRVSPAYGFALNRVAESVRQSGLVFSSTGLQRARRRYQTRRKLILGSSADDKAKLKAKLQAQWGGRSNAKIH